MASRVERKMVIFFILLMIGVIFVVVMDTIPLVQTILSDAGIDRGEFAAGILVLIFMVDIVVLLVT